MQRRVLRLLVCAGLAVCLGSVLSAAGQAVAKPKAGEKPPLMTLPGLPQPFNQGDIYFMQGMIPHHAQAIKMASMAPSHGASKQMQMLCERIIVSQKDEIKFMQMWLADRGQWVPAADATHMKMNMGGMVHDMLMSGMLTDEEMAALDKARGKEWERLFLIGMIKHHGGAITMVDELFATWGAVQSDEMYKYASDVHADQTIEIEAMKAMLAEIKGE